MDIVTSTNIYPVDWELAGQRQRVRRYKGLHSMADFVLMDGWTIDAFVLNKDPSDSSQVFSVEKPMRADFKIFCEMVQNLSSASFILPCALGSFIAQPPGSPMMNVMKSTRLWTILHTSATPSHSRIEPLVTALDSPTPPLFKALLQELCMQVFFRVLSHRTMTLSVTLLRLCTYLLRADDRS